MGQKSHQRAPEEWLKCGCAAGAAERDERLPNLPGSDLLMPWCLDPLMDDRTGPRRPGW